MALKATWKRMKISVVSPSGRHGHNKAIVAVAHSILVIAYHVLQRRGPYNELGGDYCIERQNKDVETRPAA
jgi:transposase